MNRNRINQMRQMDRGQEGLQQVVQMQATTASGQGQGQPQGTQSVRRKTTYTRTEMLSRTQPTVQNIRQNVSTAGQDWAGQLSPKQRHQQPPKVAIPLGQSTNVTNKSNTPRRHRSFLPRVARLPTKSEKSPNRIQNRLAREIGGKIEQVPVGNQTALNISNSPNDSNSTSPARRTMMANEDNLMNDSSSSTDRHKIKLAKAIRLPDDQNKSFVYLCKPVTKVKELLTARRLRNSCEHLNDRDLSSEEPDSVKLQRTFSEEAIGTQGIGEGYEGYTLVPIQGLTRSSSSSSQLDSPTLEAMQQRQKQFEAKTVFSQERLKKKLQEVYQKQKHLRQLEQDQRHQEQRQFELNLVGENLPNLQHEIRRLQQLSEKLEATLRVSHIPKPMSPKQRNSSVTSDMKSKSSTQFYTPRTSPYQLFELPITKLFCLRIEEIPAVQYRTRIQARVYQFGLVQEFRIETKTLNELKTADDSQCFYLPVPKEEPPLAPLKEADPLHCTNFRKLRENPNILLQQLRQVSGTGRPFNILDQDTMFFNSLAYGETKSLGSNAADQLEVATRETGGGGGGIIANYGGAIAYSRLSVRVNDVAVAGAALRLADQGDNLQRLTKKTSHSQVNNTTQTELEPIRKIKTPEPETEISSPDYTPNPSPRFTKRKKLEEKLFKVTRQEIKERDPKPKKTKFIRRMAPEPPVERRVEPKVRLHLLKTVLVGMVQVAVILVLIMAFTYPDVSC
ncbi:uncharacterized protein LOC108104423 [Drosophila eugracilis]|uniref:uncharacterized protein LOC108104423 n=1 Tax=Drosophila eugracilis TaxID=29029 RepID=UPI0007E73BF6|nr:uncharacterized protein LOC108104423 [Drosophila eugracilis]